MRILLVCAGGMSTSLLTTRMRTHAGPGEVIDARSVEHLRELVGHYDVVLVGPQIRYRLAEIETVCAAAGIPAGVMDSLAYGLMDGRAALAQARSLVAPDAAPRSLDHPTGPGAA